MAVTSERGDANARGAPHPLDEMLARAIAEQVAGRLAQAAALFEAMLAREPNHAEALCHYALLAVQAGRPQTAISMAQRAIAARPDFVEAYQLLGVAQRQCGHLNDAITSLKRAVELNADYFDARLNLGNALLDAADTQAASAQYEAALALNPRSASAHNNQGNLFRELRRPADAMAAYRRAIALDPAHARARANLGNMLKDLGDIDAAITAFRRSLALAPNEPDVWSNLLLTLNSSDQLSREAIYDEHRAYGEHFGRLRRASRRPRVAALAGRRLRIGYLSSDFRKHAVATFFEPLLAAHDTGRFEIFCYYNQVRGDEVTARIRACAEHFIPVAGLPDSQLAGQVNNDAIDILIDLNGHTADNRLPMFFLRPAPLQLTWLGYPGTTGVSAIDYRVTDVYADPPGITDKLHVEALWRLPASAWCYQPYDAAPELGSLPPQAKGWPTFICLNNPGKASPTVLRLWAEILDAVPQSRLLLLASEHPQRVAELRAFFAARGIAEERIELVARQPLASYLALYKRADIALDTYPYTGATTTCDALWMGVPVVTLAGDRPFARSGVSILHSAGLADFIAETPHEYVRIAVALAADHGRLALLHASLRERMRASPLTDAPRFARDVEAAYMSMCERALAQESGQRQ